MTSSQHTHTPKAALSRRRFMEGAATLGGTLWGNTSHTHAETEAHSPQQSLNAQTAPNIHDLPSSYKPQFFNDEEYLFLEHACERIFPQDSHGPGARALGVPRFIDLQMNTPYGRGELWYLKGPFINGPAELGYQLPYSPQDLYRRTITPINTHCLMTHDALFVELSSAQQDDILSSLENGQLHFNDIPGNIFFEQLRTNTLEGAFADPAYGGNYDMNGWQMMGFPGARADFMDWINQNGASYPLGPVSMPPSSQAELNEGD